MRFLRLPDLTHKVGLKKTAIYALIQRKAFPAPIRLGGASVWDESAVEQWMRQRIEEQTQSKQS
jgi:prophage regulatory protein